MRVTICWQRTRKNSWFKASKSSFLPSHNPKSQNWSFETSGLKKRLERYNFSTLDTAISFVAEFMNRTLRNFQTFSATKRFTLYSDIEEVLLGNKFETRTVENILLDVDLKIRMLKTFTKNMYGQLEDADFCTLNFHTLNYIVKHALRLRGLA